MKAGDRFPQVVMPVPAEPQDRAYLGLRGAETFTLSDVQADVVLVEILNTHCFSCRKQVQSNRKLFRRINSDPNTKVKIKIFGLAAGNNAVEVRQFREKYRVAYPIIPDPDFRLHGATGFSKTPFSLYIRKDPNTGEGRIVKTHLGLNIHYDRLFDRLTAMLSGDTVPAPRPPSPDGADSGYHKRPMSKEEIERRVQSALCSLGGTVTHIEELPSPTSGHIYAAKLKRGDQIRLVFAITENRVVPCDVCHDAHFLYVIDPTGEVMAFDAICLFKAQNVPWNKNDVSLIQSRIRGRYIYRQYPFEPEVDAVSAATITSQVIYNGLSDGRKIYEMLKKKGFDR